MTLQRVSVHPDFQRHGIASAMVRAAEDFAAELGFTRVELFARAELDEIIQFWGTAASPSTGMRHTG